MITNADITIYNRKYDQATRLDAWHRTVIHNVHVYIDHTTSVGDSGLNSADVYKIRIPQGVDCGDAYLPENEYAKMNNPSGYWTLQNDDWIVIGECQIDIGRPSDLKDLRSKHCKIISYSDNRFGGLPHWRIGGV